MKNITEQSKNQINLIGKLLDVSTATGKLKDGRDYERATVTLRITQTYGGREETSEVSTSFFGSPFTSTGKPNPAYKTIQDLKNMDTVQTVGFDAAPTIQIRSASLHENNFMSRSSGQLINTWQISASFVNQTTMADVAAFTIDIFIMDMHPEEDRDGDPTGRLIIKGGIVQYGGVLDIIEFIVEDPQSVDYIERNWEINNTVNIKGRIRVTSIEEKSSGKNSSWGEDVPEVTTRSVRELIITKGDDQGKDEEFAYDPTEIKKAFNVRKAKLEQLQLDAQKPKATAQQAQTTSKYNWE